MGGRFSDMKALDTAIADSAMTMKSQQKEKAEKINRMVYGIPGDLYAGIDNAGESFSNFAKRAMQRLAKEEGILK
jgi:hypothetical protein